MTVQSYAAPGSAKGGASPVRPTRSQAEFAAADRHSRRVRYFKLGLPLAALFATGFFASATLLTGSGAPAPSVESVVMSDGRIVMAKPKMEGFDSDKRPYSMIAERAIQLGISSNVIELEKITADLPFGKAETARLTADAGVFNNSSNKLDLKDNIRLLTSGGMQALLSRASINLANNEMSSDAPVDIKTQGSHITAGKMKIAAGGKVFVFEKRVRLKIDADRMKKAPSANGEAGTQQQ